MEFKANLIAALVILGGTHALPASADDDTTIVVTESAALSANNSADKVSRVRKAAIANENAAERAVEAVLSDVKLDLDIRLIGPTSVKIASDR